MTSITYFFNLSLLYNNLLYVCQSVLLFFSVSVLNFPKIQTDLGSGIRDCLARQVKEDVQIRWSQVPVLNAKTEWHQPALYRIQSEIERG